MEVRNQNFLERLRRAMGWPSGVPTEIVESIQPVISILPAGEFIPTFPAGPGLHYVNWGTRVNVAADTVVTILSIGGVGRLNSFIFGTGQTDGEVQITVDGVDVKPLSPLDTGTAAWPQYENFPTQGEEPTGEFGSFEGWSVASNAAASWLFLKYQAGRGFDITFTSSLVIKIKNTHATLAKNLDYAWDYWADRNPI